MLPKNALLLMPPLQQQRRRRQPRQRSHCHRPSRIVPRRRKPKKVMRTAVNKPKNELLNAPNWLTFVAGLAAGAEASAIAPPAPVQGSALVPAEAVAAAAAGDRPPTAFVPTGIRASEIPEGLQCMGAQGA